MINNNDSILSELLLELTLVIGEEIGFEGRMKKTLSVWMRRLNCTMGSVITMQDKKPHLHIVIPTYLMKKGIHPSIVDLLLQKKWEVYLEKIEDQGYLYIFSLGYGRYFLFRRCEVLTPVHIKELLPIIDFFGKSLENALERAKRLQVERELEKERRLLRTVLDHIPDGVFLKDLELKKILTNKADLYFSGYREFEDILNKKDSEVYPKEIAKDFEKTDKQILATGKPVINVETKYVNANHDAGWLLTSKFPFKNERDELVGIVGVSKDITQIKKDQAEIERLSLVASQSNNGVIITDVKGRVEWINEGFTRLSGYSLNEMKGRIPGDILQGPDTDPKVIKVMSEAIRNKKSFQVEILNYKKDGTLYWINIDCNPLVNADGHVEGFMAIESDITEKVIFREELISAKMIAESAQEAEKTFLANMSHEIRTPLNAIIGMTSLLAGTNPTAEQAEYIDTLGYSSRYLLRLITDILDLAKIESGKLDIKRNNFDIRKCLKTIQKIFLLKTEKKNLDIILKLDPRLPRLLYGDEMLLQQILNNLIGNAEKFTPEGKITIKVSSEKISSTKIMVKFDIIDTGIGMNEGQQKQVFEKFKQVHLPENEEKQGTGLGLPISKELCELMGGDIWVESEPGEGSTFSFKLPFEVQEFILENEPVANINMEENKKPIFDKILVVEDNYINMKYISRVLEKLNIPFDKAANGREAIELTYRNRYGLVLMDIQMPEMDGFEAASIIRHSNNDNKNIPIIALTASAMTNQKTKALSVGMNDYLTKPFTPDQLKELLKQFIGLKNI